MPGTDDNAAANVPQGAPEEDAYSLSGVPAAEEIDRIGSPDETTGLLNVAARPSYDNDLDRNFEPEAQPSKDSWVGAQEFEGLPWYKKPSVWNEPGFPIRVSIVLLR